MRFTKVELLLLMFAGAIALSITYPLVHEATEQRKARICYDNRQRIMEAKEAWTKAGGLVDFGEPTKEQLLPYLPDSVWPTCPSYGPDYQIGRIGYFPTCSYPGH